VRRGGFFGAATITYLGGHAARIASAGVVPRGGNGSDVNRIVPFLYPFSYFFKLLRMQIQILLNMARSGCYSDMDTDRIFSQFKTDMNKKIKDSYLIVRQVYNI
jgi:hypothetical protein